MCVQDHREITDLLLSSITQQLENSQELHRLLQNRLERVCAFLLVRFSAVLASNPAPKYDGHERCTAFCGIIRTHHCVR